MPFPLIPAAALLSLSLPGAAPPVEGAAARETTQEFAQMTFHQRIVIRVPRLPDSASRSAMPDNEAMRVVEKKGPKCVAIMSLAGGSVTRSDAVDLMSVDGSTLRARFDDECPALDFYRGFYLRQTSDGLVCAGRDALRSRSGGECRIKHFRRLIRKR